MCYYKGCEDSKIHILMQSVKVFYQQILLTPMASNFQDSVAPEKPAPCYFNPCISWEQHPVHVCSPLNCYLLASVLVYLVPLVSCPQGQDTAGGGGRGSDKLLRYRTIQFEQLKNNY